MIYLAGPITNVGPAESSMWRVKLSAILRSLGVSSFDPRSAWVVPPELLREPEFIARVQEVDDTAIAVCDGVVVRYTLWCSSPDGSRTTWEPTPSAGTDHEIQLALRYGKPIWIWASTLDMLRPWIEERFPDPEGAGLGMRGERIFDNPHALSGHIHRYLMEDRHAVLGR